MTSHVILVEKEEAPKEFLKPGIIVGRFLIEAGYRICYHDNVTNIPAWDAPIYGIVSRHKVSRQRKVFGIPFSWSEYIWYGTIKFLSNHGGHAKQHEKVWRLSVYGRGNLDLMQQLAETMSKHFDVTVEVKVESEETSYGTHRLSPVLAGEVI